MPAERLPMRHLRELLRLRHAGLPQHVIAQSLGLGQGTVSKYLSRARQAGLSWPLSPDLDQDERLEALLFPPPPDLPAELRPKPDWAEVHRELRRPDVTLTLLWEEYKARAPDGFSYSWFCDLYKAWVGRLKPTLRQVHVAGEKLFVDYAGRTMQVMDPLTGEVRTAQIFVAVLGASNFTYAEATWTQTLPDWIGAHVRAFLPGRHGAPSGQRPSESRGHQGLLPRTHGEPHRCRSRPPLRNGNRPGPTLQAARQSQGRGRRANRRALDPGALAQSSLLLARRPQ